MTDQITVSVDPEVASAYRSASENDRRNMDLLVNLRLRDATRRDAHGEFVGRDHAGDQPKRTTTWTDSGNPAVDSR